MSCDFGSLNSIQLCWRDSFVTPYLNNWFGLNSSRGCFESFLSNTHTEKEHYFKHGRNISWKERKRENDNDDYYYYETHGGQKVSLCKTTGKFVRPSPLPFPLSCPPPLIKSFTKIKVRKRFEFYRNLSL